MQCTQLIMTNLACSLLTQATNKPEEPRKPRVSTHSTTYKKYLQVRLPYSLPAPMPGCPADDWKH